MNSKVVKRIVSSNNINKAVGNYTHITKIEANSSFYTFSGQIGTDENGILPKSFNEQVDNTFLNIGKLLNSIELGPNNVIKVNIWSTQEIDWDYFDRVYNDFFGKISPSMTIAYIKALGLEEIKLEIEIWAAS